MSSPNYLTKQGAAKLQDELRQLAGPERSRLVQEVADAAAQGDRSENAEYIYGKKRLREVDRRIRFLTKRLESAVIVEATGANYDQVRFGALVEVTDDEGKKRAYTLVGPDESDPAQGRLSFQSPIGQALLRKRVGDVVVVRRPVGEVELEIISICYP